MQVRGPGGLQRGILLQESSHLPSDAVEDVDVTLQLSRKRRDDSVHLLHPSPPTVGLHNGKVVIFFPQTGQIPAPRRLGCGCIDLLFGPCTAASQTASCRTASYCTV